MISRVLLGIFVAGVMVVFGTGTYLYLGSRTSQVAAPPQKPTASTPRAQAFNIPGTLYIAQDGALYSLRIGRFHQITPEAGWKMPAMTKSGDILAVRQFHMYSDIYVLSPFGKVIRRVTNNVAPPRNPDPGANHWSFYPKLSADGKTLWMTYDQPKFGYDVVFSVWSMPFPGTIRQGKLWTNADDYAGGDVQPIPLKQGGAIYTKYSYGPNRTLVGQLYYVTRLHTFGKELTTAGDDCRSPSLSPDEKQVAMICTYEKQVSYLVIASWNGKTLGARKRIVTNQMVAQPTWAPDGSGIAYLAPAVPAGPFQLWFLPKAAYAPPVTPSPSPGLEPSPTPTPLAPVKPIQVTTNNGFDATSPLAWAT
jgi:hypothetical protein